jgi:hypothetical protein
MKIRYNGMWFKEGVIGCYFIKDKEKATECIDIYDAERFITDDMRCKLTDVTIDDDGVLKRYNPAEEFWYNIELDFVCDHCHTTFPKCDMKTIINIDGEQQWCEECYEDNQFEVELK